MAESFRNGIPVICSNRGALPDLVDEGRTGFVFEFEQFEKSLMSAFNRHKQCDMEVLSKNCRSAFEDKMTEITMSTAVIELYKTVKI
ncbi:hypothetical protein D9M71_452760 [compost metagenome]